MNRAKRRLRYQFAVLFVDLDRFKNVNDSLGHPVGDQMLVALGRRLEGAVRPEDTVARLGGDEFAILLDEIKSPADATRAAERVEKTLADPIVIGTRELFTTASIGIAIGDGSGTPEDYLRDADTAMYRAKASGRARHLVFDQAMRDRARDLLQLDMDLRRSVEREELHVRYQPIVSLATAGLLGVESLARWQHPSRGLVPPEEFIPVAEETGFVLPLGRFVLEESLWQLRHWGRAGEPLWLSVNLSPKQLVDPELVPLVKRLLEETSIAPGRLGFEITENAIMENSDAAAATLHELRSLEVHISLDDFGTGYSSLSYLNRFPIDKLKIDRSFVKDIHARDERCEIVRTIVSLAHGLGMEVMAEGVEKEEELERLWSLGCDAAQEFLFSEPLVGEETGRLIAGWRRGAVLEGRRRA